MLYSIVTPLLLENIVLDEKFLQQHELTNVLDFAIQNPELVNCVRVLQHNMAPVIMIR